MCSRSRSSHLALAFALVLAAACGGSDDGASPSAVLTSVEPACARSASATPLTLRGTMPVKPVVSLSDENESTLEIGYSAFIRDVPLMGGDVPLADVRWVDAQTITGTVPSAIPPDYYQLIVENPFGEQTVLADFQVTDGVCTPRPDEPPPPPPGDRAALEITAAAEPATLRLGEVVDVTATVRNSGRGTASDVTTAVAAPPGFEPATSPPDPLTIPSGESRTFTWTYTAVAGAGSGTFAVTASGTDVTTGEAVAAPQVSTNSVAVVYAVGGTVTGLRGSGLVLRLNGTTDVAVGDDGPFTFGTLPSGTSFAVTIATQPTGPAQTCRVSGQSGTVGTGPVTSVVVNCDVNTFTIGGTVTGLAGSGLVLHEATSGQNVTVSAGTFAFAAPVRSGASYNVTVGAQPVNPSQNCTVASGTGTVGAVNVANVVVTCSTNPVALTTATSGTGAGSILCNGAVCQPTYPFGTTIAITAQPAPGSTFTSWGGDCSEAGPCALTMTQSRTVTATFTLQTFTLSAATNGTGSGSILCNGAPCAASYPFSTTPIVITAAAATGSTFTGWGGACSGAGGCAVTMTANQTVTATFTRSTYLVTITQNPGGAVVGPASVLHGDSATFTATPNDGFSLGTWSGCAAAVGAASCTVPNVTGPLDVSMTFTRNSYPVTITQNPGGTVAGPGTVLHGDSATFTATPEGGRSVATWIGCAAPAGALSCTVPNVTGPLNVSATFTPQDLTTDMDGTGGGLLSCSAPGFPGPQCQASYPYGTRVVITAEPGLISVFGGWAGDCQGNGQCEVFMTAPRSVTATFNSRF